MRVLFAHKANTAVGLYRQWTPAKYLAKMAGWQTRVYPRWATWDRVLAGHGKCFSVDEDLGWADLADIGWFASPIEQNAMIAWRKHTAVPCVMDLDDEVRNLPAEHMAYEGFRPHTDEECFERIKVAPDALRVLSFRGWKAERDAEGTLWAVRQKADNFPERFQETVKHLNGLFVSTPYLAEEYRKILPKKWPVSVLPNCYDPDDWADVKPAPRREQPTILWAGSVAHGGNVKLAFDGLRKVFSAYPQAKLLVFGAKLKEFESLPKANVEYVNWVTLEEYPRELAAQGAWIGIAPATDHPFNHAKSHIRWMEYTLAGIPTLCSPTPEYEAWAGEGAMYANDEDAWGPGLLELIGDATLRSGLLDKARERVTACDIHKHLDTWVARCTEAVESGVTQMYVEPMVQESTNK
jgi:glycosyltransferase involved in cell wall biosynthesis